MSCSGQRWLGSTPPRSQRKATTAICRACCWDLLFRDLTDWSVVGPNGFPDYRYNDREIIRAFADNTVTACCGRRRGSRSSTSKGMEASAITIISLKSSM